MVTFDRNSIAGQRLEATRRIKSTVMFKMYGLTAFALVTDDASAIALGLVALRSGRSGAEVARGLADYLQCQEARKIKAMRDKRNEQARARRAAKKTEKENPDG